MTHMDRSIFAARHIRRVFKTPVITAGPGYRHCVPVDASANARLAVSAWPSLPAGMHAEVHGLATQAEVSMKPPEG